MKTSWISSKPIAHRGYHIGDILENSKEAFKRAIEYNLNIECDVQMTLDKQIIVFHDNDLQRLFNLPNKVSEETFETLSQLTNHQIITLKELLDLVHGQVGIVIEIKNDGIFQEITEKVIEIVDEYPYDFALKSFNMFALLRIKRLRPHFMIGKVLHKDYSFKNMVNQLAGLFVNQDFNSISFSNPVKHRKKRLPLLTWTVTSVDDYLSVDVPIFENISEEELSNLYKP